MLLLRPGVDGKLRWPIIECNKYYIFGSQLA
jgi:hypothetical protein